MYSPQMCSKKKSENSQYQYMYGIGKSKIWQEIPEELYRFPCMRMVPYEMHYGSYSHKCLNCKNAGLWMQKHRISIIRYYKFLKTFAENANAGHDMIHGPMRIFMKIHEENWETSKV